MEPYDWSQYLSTIPDSQPLPPEWCSHVEESLLPRLPIPCLAETEWSPGVCWVIRVENVCGPLLEISYVTSASDARAKKFWYDSSNKGLLSFGHSKASGKCFRPPDSLKLDTESEDLYKFVSETYSDYSLLKEDFSPSSGLCPADSLRPGLKFEWRSDNDPGLFWGVTVTENSGGLIGLSYDSPQLKQTEADFYCFYTDDRLMPCGFVASKPEVRKFCVPDKLKSLGYPDHVWKVVSQSFGEITKDNVGPAWCFSQSKLFPDQHNFEEKMLLTIVDPRNLQEFRVAVVDKIFDQFHFLVSLLEEPEVQVVCRGDSEEIVPISWAIDQKFLEKSSLQNMSCSPLSKIAGKSLFLSMNKPCEDILPGHSFELLVDSVKKEFCLATVVERRGHILITNVLSKSGKLNILLSGRSNCIFPLGWCESNNLELFVPNFVADNKEKLDPEVCDDQNDNLETETNDDLGVKPAVESSWCPPIYFNHLCYSASFLSKHKLESLPRYIGPGPVRLVMREVLSRLIGSSFKSGAVLKKLEVDGSPRPGFWLESMKGKSRVLSLQSDVEIPSEVSQVISFCREVCQKLSCCPYLFGPQLVGVECPSACNTRPKSDFQLESGEGKHKRGVKRGRKGGQKSDATLPDTNPVSGQSSTSTSPSLSCSTTRDNSPDPPTKKRHGPRNWGEILPPSDIKTRGAKLPNFGLQLKVRPSKTEVEDMERIIAEKCSESLNSSCPTSPKLLRSKSAPGSNTFQSETMCKSPDAAFEVDFTIEVPSFHDPPPIRQIILHTNPLLWTAADVAQYVADQSDISHLSSLFKSEEVDGQALLLLNLPTILEHWRLRLREAIMLARHVESVKLAFYKQFVFSGQSRRERGW